MVVSANSAYLLDWNGGPLLLSGCLGVPRLANMALSFSFVCENDVELTLATSGYLVLFVNSYEIITTIGMQSSKIHSNHVTWFLWYHHWFYWFLLMLFCRDLAFKILSKDLF